MLMGKLVSKKYIIYDKFRKRKLSKLNSKDREANNKATEGLKEILKGDISSGYCSGVGGGGGQAFSRLISSGKSDVLN